MQTAGLLVQKVKSNQKANTEMIPFKNPEFQLKRDPLFHRNTTAIFLTRKQHFRV